MHTNRRSGADRRKEQLLVHVEKRNGTERRTIPNDPDLTIGRLRMISFFEGLSNEQYKRLLSICTKKNYEPNEYIFHLHDESTIMFIIIKGKLTIQFSDGSQNTNLSPAGLIGGVGIFTGIRRSASLMAGTYCTVLSFNKEELFRIFDADTTMLIRIQNNIIRDISAKLGEDNKIIDEMKKIHTLEIL
ncbi:cyclic nucleotide-binding domain-containing protein [bacterium]|nr:cyclic nucleotide-binding domain-containing protein [bacterium]